MEPTLQEKLKAVAEFMGWEYLPSYDKFCANTMKDNPHFAYSEMLFHTDYNWLMEAWVRFRKLVPPWFEAGHEMRCDIFVEALSNRPIETAFDRLYEAIVWYNSLNK